MSREEIDALNTTAWEIGLHQPDRSRELAAQALERARAEDYPAGEALAIRTLGYGNLVAGEVEPALRLCIEAAEKLGELGDRGGKASALNSLGIIYARLGDFEKALQYSLECLSLYQSVGDRRGEAWAYIEIGNVHLAVGEHARARENFDKGKEIFDELGYKPGQGRAWNLLGNVAKTIDDPREALACYEKSLAIAYEDELAISIAGSCSSIGRIHQTLGDRDKARDYFQRAIDVSKDITLRELKAHVQLNLGRLELEEGEYDEARALLEDGLRLVDGALAKDTEYRLHEALSRLHEARGNLEQALAHYKEFHRLRDETFNEDARGRLKNLQLRMGVEQAEREAEIERLRYVELAGMQAELVQSEKMALLGRLVAGLSHEINTPVGVINANASLIARALEVMRAEGLDIEGNARLRTAVDTLEAAYRANAQAGQRLSELLGSLRSYARLDEAELQRVDISTCVAESLRLFETQLPASIRLEKNLAPLPETLCRPGQLNQAFMTLLVNAREAIDGEGHIRVRSFDEDGWVAVEIADTGRGMAPDKLDKLFEIDFTRKASHVRLRMGLSAAKTIVENHGGSIEVESEVDRGTTFDIRLPVRSRAVPYFGGGLPWAKAAH